MDEQEKREQPKTLGNVTRLEFYIGIALVLLFVVVLSLAMERAAERRAWDAVVRLEDDVSQMKQELNLQTQYLRSDMNRMPDEIERRQGSVLSWHSMRVIGVNHKAGTIRLELTASPKEYSEGLEGTFYVGRDEIEEYVAPGIFDESHILRAEIELPLCRWVRANVSLREGGSEKRQFLGEMEITESMTTPQFAGRWKEFSHDKQNGKDILTGVMEVEADFPGEWRDENTALQDCVLEVEKNGQLLQSVPMEGSTRDTSVFYEAAKYYGRIQEPVLLEEGCEIAFWFKAVDVNGASYACLLQKGTLDSKTGRYMIRKGTEGADQSGESLIIE